MTRPLNLALDVADRAAAHAAGFDLAHVVRWLGVGRVEEDIMSAIRQAEAHRAPSRAVSVVKAVANGAMLDFGLAGEWRAVTAAFLASLRDVGIVDALLSSGVNVPWISRVLAVSAIAGVTVAEAAGKSVRQLSVDPASLLPHKAAAIVVLSDDLFREAGPTGITAINDELRRGVVAAGDGDALTVLLNGVTPTASTGTITGDVHALLSALSRDSLSRLIFAVGANVRDMLDAMPATDLPEALRRWPVIRSDQVDADAMLAINASSIVVSDGGLRLDAARHAALQMDTDPTQASDSPPTATQLVSMWQTNSVAVRAEREFKLAIGRADAVAAVSDVAWIGGSP